MSDYGGFGAIAREARALEREERAKARTPVDCPVCGEPLDVNPRGVRNCPHGHYQVRAGGR